MGRLTPVQCGRCPQPANIDSMRPFAQHNPGEIFPEEKFALGQQRCFDQSYRDFGKHFSTCRCRFSAAFDSLAVTLRTSCWLVKRPGNGKAPCALRSSAAADEYPTMLVESLCWPWRQRGGTLWHIGLKSSCCVVFRRRSPRRSVMK